MSTWAERLLTCMHGRQEGLDSHDCPECQEIAKKLGWEESDSGYIITHETYKKLKKKHPKELA